MLDFMAAVVANRTMIMVFVLLLASLAIIIVLVIAQFKKDSFDMRSLVVDDTTGKPSIHKAGQGVALIVSTWGFVYQIVHGRFTDTYLLVYMGWAGIEAVNRLASNRLGNGSGNNNYPPYPNQPPYCPPQTPTYPTPPVPTVPPNVSTPVPLRPAVNNSDFADDDHPVVRGADRPLK